MRERVRELLRPSDLIKTKIQKCVVEEGDERTRRPLSLRDLFVPGIVIAAINLSSTYLLQAFYLETEVLYLSTPIRDGGLGFSPWAIGTLSSISATVTGMSQLFIFPHVHERWGSKYVFVLGLFAFIPSFVLWPLMNWIAKKDGYSGLVWFGLSAQICCSAVNGFAWRKSWLKLTLKSRVINVLTIYIVAISVFITQSYGSRASVVGFCQVCFPGFFRSKCRELNFS